MTEQATPPPPTPEQLRRAVRELYDALIAHCKQCLDCRINEAGRPVVMPGYCVKGGGLRTRYEAAYAAWYPHKPVGTELGTLA